MAIFIPTIVALLVTKRPIENTASELFNRCIPESKFPLGSELRKNKADMLGERIFRLVINVTCVALLYKILLQEDCDFLSVYLGGTINQPTYFQNYPCMVLPEYLDDFYVFKLSYHFYELIYTLLLHRGRPDFPEYVLHHLMTWSLIFFSYSLTMLPMGSIVMLVHDVTDLIVTLFKLTIDITPLFVQFSIYSSMLASWVYFRLWYFPVHLIYHLYWECYTEKFSNPRINFSMLNMLFAFIVGLACLHLFWFFLMVQGLVRRIRSKDGFKHAISLKSNANR